MSRAEWILGIILVVLLLAVGVLSLLLWFGPEENVPVAGQVEEAAGFGQTAATAALQAESTARDWQPDAQLLRVTATWPQGTSLTGLTRGQQIWNLTYYSAAATAVAEIVVLEDSINLLSTRPVENPLAPMAASGWNIDSSEAIRLFMDNGGAAFGRGQPDTNLVMNLDTGAESGRMEWLVSLFAAGSGASYTMRIDATTGEILEKLPVP